MKKRQKTKRTMGLFRVIIMCLALAGLSQLLMGGCGGSSGDTPPPPVQTATIVATDSDASENGDTGSFTITLTIAPENNMDVYYSTSGDAVVGTDYDDSLGGIATVLAGQTSAVITITPDDDGLVEFPETATLTLGTGVGYVVGDPHTATITITDNDIATVSGTVSGAVSSGVKVTLSGDASDTTTTDGTGNYSFMVLGGNYTVLPSLSGHVFTPSYQAATVLGVGATGKNFTSTVSNDTVISDLVMTLKAIPAGMFTMGSPIGEIDRDPNEGPQHTVMISQNFWMASTEITQAQYQAIIGSNPSDFTGDTSCPVEMVSWDDAVAFCQALTTREMTNIPVGYVYRLPTEAEWEYCCRAGTTTTFSYGQDGTYVNMDTYLWYDSNSGLMTNPVAQKTANSWGLYDMHGNVWEWCHDWYSSTYYTLAAQTDPSGPTTGDYRVKRGGSWTDRGWRCRSAYRYPFASWNDFNYLGFRVVLAPSLPSVPTATIAADEVVTATIAATDPDANEGGDIGSFTITLMAAPVNDMDIYYSTSGTALVGIDYDSLGGIATVLAGQTSAVITITPDDDIIIESTETVTLTLSAGAGYVVGAPNNATVTITDND